MMFTKWRSYRKGMDPTENQIQISIVEYARKTKAFDEGWTFHSIPNQGRTKADKIHAWRMGQVPGVGDLIFINPFCVASYMEVKRCDGKQSGMQEGFEYHCDSKNMKYFVVRSLDDAFKAFEIIGFPLLGK